MKRYRFLEFRQETNPLIEPSSKRLNRQITPFNKDIIGTIITFVDAREWHAMRQVSREWDYSVIEQFDLVKITLHILGSKEGRCIAETECATGHLYTRTTYYGGFRAINTVPDFFHSVLIDSLSLENINRLFRNGLGTVRDITILNSSLDDESFTHISSSKIERLAISSTIEHLSKSIEIPSVKSLILFDPEYSKLNDRIVKRDDMDCICLNETRISKNQKFVSLLNDDKLPSCAHLGKVERIYILNASLYNESKIMEMSSLYVPNLEELHIGCDKISCGSMQNDLSIKKLVISGCTIDIDTLLCILTKCPKLKQLCLKSCKLILKREGEVFSHGADEWKASINGCIITMPPIDHDESQYDVYDRIPSILDVIQIPNCRLKSLVICECDIENYILHILLNCSITEKATSLCIARTRISGYMPMRHHLNLDATPILLRSKCLNSLTRLVLDISVLDSFPLNSNNYLLLCPLNMRNLKHLTIDMSRNPMKAITLGIKASRLPKITIDKLSVCLAPSDINIVALSNYITSVEVISTEGTQSLDYDSYECE